MKTTRATLWRPGLASALCCVLLACGAEPPAPAPTPKKASAGEPEAKKKAPKTPKTPEKTPEAAKAPPSEPAQPSAFPPIDFGEEGALSVVEGLRGVAGTDKQESWLASFAVFPFDVDGVHKPGNVGALTVALGEEHPTLSETMAAANTCEALTRARILEGTEAFHYIDRLGQRPPADELSRDLDRLGLREGDVLVNCFEKGSPGLFFVVVDRGGKARLGALRK